MGQKLLMCGPGAIYLPLFRDMGFSAGYGCEGPHQQVHHDWWTEMQDQLVHQMGRQSLTLVSALPEMGPYYQGLQRFHHVWVVWRKPQTGCPRPGML